MSSSSAAQQSLTFGIAGAGIAGLAAAIALHQAGHRAAVFEKAPHFKPIGAGIGITPNGVSVLDALGVGGEVRKRGATLNAVELRTSGGLLLSRLDLRRIGERLGAPAVAIHRADLHRALISALPEEAVRTGSEVKEISETADGVTLAMTDGTEHEVDALIGADGIHSRIRDLLHGGEPPRYAGYAAWRGVCQAPSPGISDNSSIEIWGRNARFGAAVIGGGRIYWWLARKSGNPGEAGPTGLKEAALRICEPWKGPAAALISATPAEEILWRPVYDRPTPVKWGRGLVTLIGDAAHPMTPNLAQGASQALEDAVALADCCGSARSAGQVRDAFRAFEAQRTERVTRMVNLSSRFGKVSQLEWLPAVWLRNAVVRLTPGFIVRRQFVSLVKYGMR